MQLCQRTQLLHLEGFTTALEAFFCGAYRYFQDLCGLGDRVTFKVMQKQHGLVSILSRMCDILSLSVRQEGNAYHCSLSGTALQIDFAIQILYGMFYDGKP